MISTREQSQNDAQIINFGAVKENSINLHRIYLKNSYNPSLELKIDEISNALSGSAFQFVKTDCETNLLNDKVCFIDIKLVNDSTLSYSPVNLDLAEASGHEFFGKITLVGERLIATPVKSYQFINIGQVVSIVNPTKSVRIYIKNDGDKVINPQINVPAEYSVNKTSCDGVFQKDKVCFIDLTISSSIDSHIIGVNKKINFDGKTFSITAGISAPDESLSCSPNFVFANNACQQTVQIRSCNPQPEHSSSGYEESLNGGVSWSSCKDYACGSQYTNIGGVCTLTNQVQSCAFENGTGQRTSTDAGLTWGACTIVACNESYVYLSSNNTCVIQNQDKSCTIANGSGTQHSSDGGVSYGSCTVQTCNTNYTQIGNSCIQTNQSRSCLSQPANSSGGTESTSNGGTTWGDCSSYTCLTGYAMNASNQCVPNVKNFGTYRAWSDNTYALSCENYKNPTSSNSYSGDIGSYIYRVRPLSSTYDVFCDMTITPAYLDITNGLVANFSMDGSSMVESITVTTLSATFADTTIYAGKRSGARRPITFSGSVALSQNMTTCAWLNIPTGFSSASHAPYYGFGRYSGNAAYDRKYWSRLSPLGYYGSQAQVVGPTVGTSSDGSLIVLKDNSWHHYCTILNNTAKTAKTYRDGVLIYTATSINNWGIYGTTINFLNETVDTTDALSAPQADEWKLYNRELSFEEVRILGQNTIFNSELIINGDFSNGLTGWTGSYGSYNTSGALIVSTGVNGSLYAGQAIATTIGSTYKVTYTILGLSGPAGISSNAYAINSGENRRSGTYRNVGGGTVAATSAGSYTYNFIANSSSTDIVFATEIQTGNTTIDNVKVELVP